MKKTLSLLLLSFIMILSIFVFPVRAEDIYTVVPTESDYTVSNSIITGLKPTYIDSLTDEQKQNIQLILPATINGKAITGIGDKAFSQYFKTTCRFTKLDLSSMTSLKSIGAYAFYSNNSMQGNLIFSDILETIGNQAFEGCKSLNGDLVLPNSLRTLGTYAFSGCTNMNGKLTLSNQLEVIPNYAFKDAGLTGTLTIPASVNKISDSAFRQSNPYNGFSGKLIIPDSVKTVEKVAFSSQNSINDIQFSQNMKSIPESMFNKCKGLNGVLVIPNNIQSIGVNAFSETMLKTVYLPEIENQNDTAFMKDSPFKNCSPLTAIICKEKDFQSIKSMVTHNDFQKKITYEKQIQFQDKANNIYQPLLKLYNLSYQYVKQNDDSWKLDSSFQFPKIISDETGLMKWSTTNGSHQPLASTAVVGNEKVLYEIETFANPVITYSEGIDKVYDGLPARLSVNATHDKYVNIKDAVEGDIVFYYTWKFATIGSSSAIQAGFDLNTLDLTDVYNPNFGIVCSVTIQACYVENNKAKPYYTVSHDFGVHIKQVKPTVNPIHDKTIQYKDGLPDIKLSTGDTVGVISWDDDQILQEGTHLYNWTFIPKKNEVGSNNYTTLKGTAEVTALNPKIFNVNVKDNGYGQVSPSYSYQVTQGEKTTLTITPNSDYSVTSLKINGKECLSQSLNNVLIIENVQSDYDIDIKFDKCNVDNVEQIISELPKLTENQKPTQEQVISILEARIYFENLGSLKDNVSKDDQKQFNELLMKLPQIEVSTGSYLVDNSVLLDNMNIEDIETLLNDPNATLSIHCDIIPDINDAIYDDIENHANDMIVSSYYDIEITKKISSQGQDFIIKLSELATPIQMILEIPTELPPIKENHKREYYVIRVHGNGDDKEITILNNESKDDSNVMISTQKFSIYAIAYIDTELSSNPETPDLPNIPTEPGNKPSVITNDEQNMTLWVILGLSSLIVGTIYVFYNRKSNIKEHIYK